MMIRSGFVTMAVGLAMAALPGAPARADDIVIRLNWVAGGLTEAAVVARMLEVSPRMRGAESARAQAARSAKLRAADFVPRIDLRASYTRLSYVNQPSFDFGGTVIDNPFPQLLNQYGVRASISVPITDYFLAILPGYRAAGVSAELARYQSEAQRVVDALRARETFLGLARVEAAAHVAEEAVSLLKAHIDELEALFAAAQVTKADVMQARAQLAEAEVGRDRLNGAVDVTRASLREILHLDESSPIEIGENLDARDPVPIPDVAELRTQAMTERAEVQGLKRLAALHRHQELAAQGGRWPRLAVVAGLDYANPNARSLLQEDEFSASWDMAVVLNWSPNDVITGGIRASEAAVEAQRALADLDDLRERIAIQVTQAVSDLRVATSSIRSAQEGVFAAREAWRVQRDLLAAGESTPNDVLDAEVALRRAQLSLIDARIDVRVALARIEYAGGRASHP